MERTRNGLFLLVVPALAVVALAALALGLCLWRWFEADARGALTRRVADAAASAERLLDASVDRQVQATRVLGTSPVAWLWVKFQGQRLTVSNRSHAQAALDEVNSYASLLPGATVYLASEHTRAVYQSGAAVAALSSSDPGDAWYAATLGSEGVVVSDDPRQVRTSMRVMNGTDLIGAVSCVSDVSRLAAAALAGADDERTFSFVLADRTGSILVSRGPQVGTASTVFDLFDAKERARVGAAMDLVTRPAGMTVDLFSSHGRRLLAAVTRTGAPGWLLVVSAEVPPVPAGRIVVLAAIAAAALALVAAAILLVSLGRSRRVQAAVSALTRQRDEAAEISREASAAAARIRAAALSIRERAKDLERESAAGLAAAADAVARVGETEEQAAELRSGIEARLSLLTGLASGVRSAASGAQQAQSAAGAAGQKAARAEEELNRIITTASAAALALETASKAAEGAVQTAEKARILALNTSLEASRSAGARRAGAEAAEEMRRLAEGAAQGARDLSAALAEARENLRVVSRTAEEAGTDVHEAAVRATESSGLVESSFREIGETVSRLESAQANAEGLRAGAVTSDQARSTADGLARILERVASICGEISTLAGETGVGETAQEPPAPNRVEPGRDGPHAEPEADSRLEIES